MRLWLVRFAGGERQQPANDTEADGEHGEDIEAESGIHEPAGQKHQDAAEKRPDPGHRTTCYGHDGRKKTGEPDQLRIIELPIGFWDERLSTVAAERALLEADTTRKRRSQVIDHVAAGYILQGALDRLAHLMRGKA